MKKIDLVQFDHIAVNSSNIQESISWYNKNFNIEVLYQDLSWGLIEVGNAKIAFVVSHQHPPHICFNVDKSNFDFSNSKFKKHRDGSSSKYIKDPDGNFIELLKWN